MRRRAAGDKGVCGRSLCGRTAAVRENDVTMRPVREREHVMAVRNGFVVLVATVAAGFGAL
jgi:uncharacterized membrane protein